MHHLAILDKKRKLLQKIISVEKVLFFSDITKEKYKDIIGKYAEKICLQNRNSENYVKQKYNYVTLIFIKDVQEITPFEINKKGYGLMAAWITVENIEKLKKKD